MLRKEEAIVDVGLCMAPSCVASHHTLCCVAFCSALLRCLLLRFIVLLHTLRSVALQLVRWMRLVCGGRPARLRRGLDDSLAERAAAEQARRLLEERARIAEERGADLLRAQADSGRRCRGEHARTQTRRVHTGLKWPRRSATGGAS